MGTPARRARHDLGKGAKIGIIVSLHWKLKPVPNLSDRMHGEGKFSGEKRGAMESIVHSIERGREGESDTKKLLLANPFMVELLVEEGHGQVERPSGLPFW